MLETQPNRFYCERLAPDPQPPEPQGIAAAVGSAFDAYVKAHIATQNKWEDILLGRLLSDTMIPTEKRLRLSSMSLLEALLFVNVEKQHEVEAREQARLMFEQYKRITQLNYVDLEIHRRFTTYVHNIPLFMKLDASVVNPFPFSETNNVRYVPHDWKTTGYSSKSVAPKPGYWKLYDGGQLSCHENYHDEIAFDTIDVDFATQLCTYGWGLGIPILTPFPATIDMIVIRTTGIRFARYRGWITTAFQQQTLDRYHKAWVSLRTGNFLRTLPNDSLFVEVAASNEHWWSR
jgi:hypothetical protein